MNERFWWLWMVLPAATGEGIILLLAFLYVRFDAPFGRWKKLPLSLRAALLTPGVLATVVWLGLSALWFCHLHFGGAWPPSENAGRALLLCFGVGFGPLSLFLCADGLTRRFLRLKEKFPRPSGGGGIDGGYVSNSVTGGMES